jgi:hypothetical protein
MGEASGQTAANVSAAAVEAECLVRGRERRDVVGAPGEPLDRGHHRRAVPAPPDVGPHGDPLDVAGAQRAAVVQHATLHQRGVADERVAVVGQRVHPAEAVLPVLAGELAVERPLEQVAGGPPDGRLELPGVGDDDPHAQSLVSAAFAHSTSP